MNASGPAGEFKVLPRTYLLWLAIIGLIPLLVIFRQNATNQGKPLSQHEFMQKATNDLIARATITLDSQSPQSRDIRGFYYRTDSEGRKVIENGKPVEVPFVAQVFLTDERLEALLSGATFESKRPNTLVLNLLWSLGPILLVALLIYFFLIRQLKSAASRQRLDQRKPPGEFAGIIHIDPEIVQRAPVFVGTNVPLQRLVDALERGESIEKFLADNPSVKKNQVIAVIEAGKQKMLETLVK
jgi:uncharacterized protein (DUF433 family)